MQLENKTKIKGYIIEINEMTMTSESNHIAYIPKDILLEEILLE